MQTISIVLNLLLAASVQQPSVEPKLEKRGVCDVLEVAYSASVQSIELTYPRKLISEWRAATLLQQYAPRFITQLPISSEEFFDLRLRQSGYIIRSYNPECKWKGAANHSGEGTDKWSTSFSNPIFSNSGKLALVNVSFYTSDFGYGQTCVARKVGRAWDAKCLQGWIN